MPISRRDVLKAGGITLAANALTPIAKAETAKSPPKKLSELLKRDKPQWVPSDELKFIGMPVGGLFAGTVYLGGDGQLWNWDIFNQGRFGCVERTNATYMGESLHAGSGANYVDPVRQQSPFQQQFRLVVEDEGNRVVRFGDIQFRGEYPVGKIRFRNADADVEMDIEAFSPFCPLNVADSSHPATTLTFSVRNIGSKPIKLRLEYGSENPVLIHSRKSRSDFRLVQTRTSSGGVQFAAEEVAPAKNPRPDVLIEDWSSGTYGAWKTTGTAFGDRPRKVDELPSYMGPVNAGTTYVVNSHQNRNGEDVVQADTHIGTLTSPPFPIDRPFLNLRIGGGGHKGGTCVNLIVDGKIVRSVSGRDSNVMRWESLSVEEFAGTSAAIQVVDNVRGGWGQVSLGEVVLSDKPKTDVPIGSLPDYGTFCIDWVSGTNHFETPNGQVVCGRKFELAPGASQESTLVLAWHFPNAAENLPGKRNAYANRWASASEVSRDLIARWKSLQKVTRDWNSTWYDSTLPHWFLDRTFVNTSILATTTCHCLDDGRYYFWEGVGCCAGTCTHVWGYAQAIARVFPEIERYLREKIDFGMAYHAESGAIDYRAEYARSVAVDGQASCILRAYREHQMAPDSRFLTGIYPQVKGAMQYLIRQDSNRDGILDGAQYNTLDTAWYGEIAWISSLYVAALRAAEAMATEMGDTVFAKECAGLAASGSARITKELFNGEYFIHKVDAAHPEANNTNNGCHIDQVYGQSWAHQVGLPRVLPVNETRSALKSLYKYSFYEDIWDYRRRMKAIPGGRWYAVPKEAGLIMCSFPKGGAAESVGKGGDAWAVQYFNECMSGFEYQVANHMISEGMLEEGLRLVFAIHDRYHPRKRNPYNEVECSDHYGRAMASYGAYVSITGFSNHGPKRQMSFAPKIKGAFKCAFINERGWGTWSRDASGKESVVTRYQATNA